MKIGIDMGHNCKGDIGAIAIKREDDLNIEVGVNVINKLKNLGYNVVVCNPKTALNVEESLYKRAEIANINKVDVYLSIHFNSGGEHGVEALAISDESKNIAEKILNEISKLGYENRGVKNGKEIYTLKNIRASSILLRCGFVDSQEDMKRYNSEDIGSAIVKGLTGKEVTINNHYNDFAEELKNVIKKNISCNVEILKAQKILNRLQIDDYRRKPLKEDGIIGNKTVSAIKKFQSVVGIKRDGIIAENTMKIMNKILEKPLLKIKVSNPRVIRYIQWRLETISDGIFGNKTRNSVINYQRKNKLNTDGIIGKITWTALIK